MGSNLIIARRKGNKFRVFDADRAKMGPWQEIPPADPYFLKGSADKVREWTVPVIRGHAAWLGLRVPSKMRKDELADIVAVRTYFRQFTVGRPYYGPSL